MTVYLVEQQLLLRHRRVAFQALSKNLTHRLSVLACFFATIGLRRVSAIVLIKHKKLLLRLRATRKIASTAYKVRLTSSIQALRDFTMLQPLSYSDRIGSLDLRTHCTRSQSKVARVIHRPLPLILSLISKLRLANHRITVPHLHTLALLLILVLLFVKNI